ncbi:MAG: hypothetical protein AAGM22_09235 [Acidobacteriota bacterium]
MTDTQSQVETDGGRWLAANVYLWEELEQNRYLVEVFLPFLRRYAGGDSRVDVVSYDRFDARGPHLFLVFRVVGDLAQVQHHFETVTRTFLDAGEVSGALSEIEVAKRHDDCRGKQQWSADGLGGLASDRTFLVEEQAAGGYPFNWWGRHEPSSRRDISLRTGDAARWSLDRIRVDKEANMGAAVIWAAEFDAELRRHLPPSEAADYWRLHATTLLMSLVDRWREEPEAVLASLPGRVAPKTAAAFTRLFGEADGRDGAGPCAPMAGLVSACLDGAPDREAAWRALREIHHITWKQLGVYVKFHIPIVLFAWNRNIELGG